MAQLRPDTRLELMHGGSKQNRVSDQAMRGAYGLIAPRYRLGWISPLHNKPDDPGLLGGRHPGKRQRRAGGTFGECTIGLGEYHFRASPGPARYAARYAARPTG